MWLPWCHKWDNRDSERLSNFREVTQLVSGRAEIQTGSVIPGTVLLKTYCVLYYIKIII